MKAFALAMLLCTGVAMAAPVSYTLDPTHTFPSFEADHMGISTWRGKFNQSKGKATLDKAAGTGSVEVSIDLASVDFGNELLNRWARTDALFDVTRHQYATYRGELAGFQKGVPTRLDGELTLGGTTRPVNLKLLSFKCVPHPMFKREVCGADALGSFERDQFGLTAGKEYGFDMTVVLRIQVEGLADQ